MGTGIITTARGKALNIDELIQQAQRPIGTKDEHSTRETGNFKPTKSNEPKVRGFVPAAGEVEIKSEEKADEKPKKQRGSVRKVAAKKTDDKTLAEMTAVKVERKAGAKKEEAQVEETAVSEEDETLGDIMKEMDEKS